MKHPYVFIRSFLVFFLLCLMAGSTLAQISVSVQVIPPYRYRIADYASHPEQLLVTLLNTTSREQRVQLRGALSGDNGVEMRVKASFKSSSAMVMAPGEVKVMDGSYFPSFFDLNKIDYTGITEAEALRGNGLPEGNYRLCVQAFNYDTNVALSPDQPNGCSNMFSVTNLEPPIILSPSNQQVVVTNAVQLLTLSWSTPPGAPPTIWYKVRIVEILGNSNPNDAIMTAKQPIFFENEVMGNMYVYNPGDPQLTLGRRYAMMVTAFDPTNAINFRNKGQSAVISFTYGTATQVVATTDPLTFLPTDEPTVVPTIPVNSTLKGIIAFAYSSSEEKEEAGTSALAGTVAASESVTSETISNAIPGQSRIPLEKANITVYGKMGLAGEVFTLGTGVSASDGSYSISINTITAEKCEDIYMVVKHDDNQLYPVTKTLKLQQTAEGYSADLGTTVLQIISMRIKPFVLSNTSYTNNQISASILLAATKYNASPLMKAAGLGKSGDKVVFNNVTYVVLAKLTSGNTFKQLFRSTSTDGYLVQVTGSNKPSVYYPLGNFSDRMASDTSKVVSIVSKNFVYNPSSNELEGIVSFATLPMSGTRITATVKNTDITDNSTVTTFEAVSDLAGYYKFATLPALKKGAIINLSVTERSIQETPLTFEVATTGALLLTKNIVLTKWVATLIGRVTMGRPDAPHANVLVTVKGTNISTRTNADGAYILKVPYPFLKQELIYQADGYADNTEVQYYISPNYYYQGKKVVGPYTALQWSKYINLGTTAFKRFTAAKDITAQWIGVGTGTLQDAFSTYFNPGEDVYGMYEAVETKLTPSPGGDAYIRFKLDDKMVAAKVWIDGVQVQNAEVDKQFVYRGLPGNHTFVVEPASSDVAFLKVTGEFSIVNGAYGYLGIEVKLKHAMMISGVVRDLKTGEGLDSALVSIVGLPYKVMTNSKGEYQFSLPNNREYTIAVVRPTYEGAVETRTLSSSQVLDFPIPWIDPSFPILKTLAGYPVTISKIVKISDGNFLISGSLNVTSNDLYTIDAANATLTFTDIAIKAEPKDINAIPVADVSFEQAVLPVRLHGIGQVEVQGVPFIQLKGIRAGDYANAVIGGNQLLLKLSATSSSDNLPVHLPDMVIKDEAMLGNTFNYVFGKKESPITELSKDRVFKMHFLDEKQPDYATLVSFSQHVTSDHYGTEVGIMGALFVDKTTASFSSAGYTINAYYQFPEIGGLTIANADNRINLEKLTMKPGESPQSIILPVNNDKPFTGTMQSFKVIINKMEIMGLGSANSSLLMGGKVLIFKEGGDPKSQNGVLTIKSLSFVKKADENKLTLSAMLNLPQGGLTINSLNFSTPAASNEIGMSYNFADNSFELEAAGILNYTSNSSSLGSVIRSVFPIKIDKFRMRSKDWDLYLVASPNIQVDLRVAKIHVDKILVNVGYGMTMQAMNDDLVSTVKNPPMTTAAVAKMEQMEESKSTWAIGIAGGITFPIDGLTTGKVAASLLVGNVGKGIEVMLNELELEVKTGALTLAAKVKMKFGDDKQGFEAAAKLTTLNKEFAASFKYYSLAGGDIELGASITTNAGVVTGPIMWHTIGGGFEYSSRYNFYNVRFNGDIGPVGVPKLVMYVKADVGILFDGVNCGKDPILYGNGTLVMKGKTWGTMGMTADFCKKMLMVTVNNENNVHLMDGLEGRVTGVFYGLAPQKSSPNGSFFMGVNTNAEMGNLIRGNVFAAFGYNYNNNSPGAPAEAKTLFKMVSANALDANGMMNAIYAKGTLSVPGEGDYVNLDIAGFDVAEFRYNVSLSGSMELYYKYVANTFYSRSAFNAGYDFFIRLLGVSLGAKASTGFMLAGGYDSPTNNWYVNGKASLNLEFYNQQGASCNSLAIKMCDPPQWCPCFDWFWGIPYPNGRFNCSCGSGWIPCGYYFKICTGFTANFSLSTLSGVKVDANAFK